MMNNLNAKELKGMIGLYEKTLNTEKNTIKMIEETIELNKKSVEIIKKELDICERLYRRYHVSGLRNKKYREKEENMIQINKTQAIQLNKNYNVPFKDGGISHTYSKHGRKYYLTASDANIEALNQLTNDKKNRLNSIKSQF